MKKLLILASVASLFIGLGSCSNDFELIDTWKDIPVVYGLLTPTDTAHYIRVEKAFLDESTSALEIATQPDSLYYENAVVSIIRLATGQEYVLSKVDGNLEGFQRESGPFADSPNYLYKLKFGPLDSLMRNEKYQLVINRGDDLPLVTGETTILDFITIAKPNVGQSILWSYETDLDFRWSLSTKESAAFFDAYIDIHYTETINGVEEEKVIEWQVASNETNEENRFNVEVEIPGESFFQTVAANIDGSVAAVREIGELKFRVLAGGQELYDYIQVNKVNTGITGSQLLPNFTNMSEGYGIFSGTYVVEQTHLLNFISRDSLANGQYTKNLGFQ